MTMPTDETPDGRLGAAPSDGGSGAADPRAPGQSAPREPSPQPPANPRGEPEAPTDKPLPDLPNPTEVGEDG